MRFGSTPALAGICKVSAAVMLLTVFCSGALRADEAFARSRIDEMSRYLAAQSTLSFNFDSSLDVVTADDRKLTIASSGGLALQRPDKLRVIRQGGFASVEVAFNGKVLSVLNRDASAFAQADFPGTIDTLVRFLHDELGRPVPGADLLLADPAAVLMDGARDVKDLGAGVIGGRVCDHFAVRSEDVDWQIWIARGEAPYPCRYVITNKDVAGWPEYRLDVSSWGKGAAAAEFTLEPPAGAKLADIRQVPDLDEVPDIFVIKEAN
jgi:hypothetical protein